MPLLFVFVFSIVGLRAGNAHVAVEEAATIIPPLVPVIDLDPWVSTIGTNGNTAGLTKQQQQVVHDIHRACREVGFFMIRNHQFNTTVMENAWTASREFFEMDSKEKLLHKTNNESEYPYGYEQTETLVKGKLLDDEQVDSDDDFALVSDLKETFSIGPSNINSGMPPRRWIKTPNLPNTFQRALEEYYRHMERLAMTLLEIFALALDEQPNFFENKMDHHMSALRLVHYYPLQQPKFETHVVRAGAHTDYGALTILAAQNKGLEVLLRYQDHREKWIPVPLVPGTFIINLGDLMQRWTNDRWISTHHRVAMPSTDANERRYSMAFFVNINGDTLIEPLKSCTDDEGDAASTKYPVISAGDHLMAKHLASMGETRETVNTKTISDEL
jgi:isopenicillin N synthase-like dioxygenase